MLPKNLTNLHSHVVEILPLKYNASERCNSVVGYSQLSLVYDFVMSPL